MTWVRGATLGMVGLAVAACASVLGVKQLPGDEPLDAGTDAASSDATSGSDAMDSGAHCPSPTPSCDPGLTACCTQCVALGTDPNNCGACGHGCLGGLCSDGVCQATTLFASPNPVQIAADPARVYWTDTNLGVLQISVDGGTPITLRSVGGGANPQGIAVFGSSVYWAEMGAGLVLQVAIGGGDVVTLAQNLSGPCGVAVDQAGVYYTDQNAGIVAAIRGGVTSTLATGQSNPCAIAIDGVDVYWVNTDSIVSAPKTGSATPHTLASGQAQPSGIATGSSGVYFTNDVTGGSIVIVGLAADGGGPRALVGNLNQPNSIAVDESGVYWVGGGSDLQGPGTVERVSLDGGARVSLFSQLRGGQTGIALNATNVFWGNDDFGTIDKIAKP